MAKRPVPVPRVFITPGVDRVPLDDEGREIPREFSAVFDETPRLGVVEIDVAASRGHARVDAIRIRERNGAGVSGVTLDGVPLERYLEEAITVFARLSLQGDEGGAGRRSAIRATRKRVTDERLSAVADAWREGGVDAVIALEVVSERTAYRLRARAIEAGLLTEED
jgi:hypothetical protein